MKGLWSCAATLLLVYSLLSATAGASRLPLAYIAPVVAAEASSNATTSPLLASPVFPLYDKLTPANMVTSLRQLFGDLDAGITALETTTPDSWDALLAPYERLGDRLNMAWGVVEHLQSVKNSDELRAAIAEVQDDNVRLGNRFSESRHLYDAFARMQNSTNLTEVQSRIVEGILLTGMQGGVTLQGAQLERFNEVTLELSSLSTNFSNNAVDATAAFTKLVNDSAQMAGLPASFLAQAAQKASAASNVTATPEAGPWLITLDQPSYTAIMTFSANRELREEVYRAYITRASTGDSDNGPVMESILALRREQANLTGYANYAEFSLASKMANMTTAMKLLEELRAASYDTAAKELKSLQGFAASQNFTAQLMNWDVSYFAQLQQQALFNLTDEEVRPYFVYDNVLQGLFQLGHCLFNVTVEAADGEVPVWDPAVRFFRLFRNGALKGYLYIDPFARPGEKSAGAWMDGIVGQSELLAAPGEKMRLPVAIIVCNQSPPVGSQPPLMTMDEVVTVFHEFGHAMQHTMTMQTDVLVSGIAGIEQDAVEQPSQMLERWPYTRNVLFSFARHFQTNESMPEELYQKLIAARNYRSGTDSLRQLFYALMDLRVHAEYVPGANTTVEQSAVYKDVVAKTSVMPPLPEDRFLNSFTHIFSGGYAAGYYGYKWAQVMSLDGFSAFEEIGLNATAAIADEGLRYRNTILADGGGRAPLLVFEDFRGRPPLTKPLLRDEDLLPTKGAVSATVVAESLDL